MVATSFNVRHIDGVVRVGHASYTIVRELGTSEGIEYADNEELRLSVSAVDTAPWREGKVIYQDVELGKLLTDLDRYLPGSLHLTWSQVANDLILISRG